MTVEELFIYMCILYRYMNLIAKYIVTIIIIIDPSTSLELQNPSHDALELHKFR